ncbi:hypothetical protein PINS_up019320 [Pythium insidiosum]|nr:hypothetical protein PINS_up019320 [Pythium insidiosum]
MKFFLATAICALAACASLTSPVQAAECTPQELLQYSSVMIEVLQSGECASVKPAGKEPTAKEVCKVPGCVTTIKASLDKWPDCTVKGENARKQLTALTQCGSSSSSTTSPASSTAVTGAVVVVATAVAAVIA